MNACRTVRLLLLVGCAMTASLTRAQDWGPLSLLGQTIAPGETYRFPFVAERTFVAAYLNTPIFVVRGVHEGPTVCLTAGVHGDELNGVEVARRVFEGIDAQALQGTLIALPMLNAAGVRSRTRYLSDRRDLNRAFPGNRSGSVASLIADAVFSRVTAYCDALIDLHTASNNRENLPQVRADLTVPAIRDMAMHFGIGIVVHGAGPKGSLRREVADAGIPAIIYEAGEPGRFQEPEIARGVEGVHNVLEYLGLLPGETGTTPPSRVFRRSRWVRAEYGVGGFFLPEKGLGDQVQPGDFLGRIVDPLTGASSDVIATDAGTIIGMSLSQPVLPGYALFHVAEHD